MRQATGTVIPETALHGTDNFVAITTSDTVLQPLGIRGIYVGGTGDVTVQNVAGTAVTFKAVPVGTVLPISPRIVKATGTTATLLIALL